MRKMPKKSEGNMGQPQSRDLGMIARPQGVIEEAYFLPYCVCVHTHACPCTHVYKSIAPYLRAENSIIHRANLLEEKYPHDQAFS